MKFVKKREIIYCENKIFPFSIGYSLCTIYISLENKKRPYKLYNFGYSSHNNDFYYNDNIHLPRELIKSFERSNKSTKIESEMHHHNIYSVEELYSFINNYGENELKKSLQKVKTK